MTAIRKSPELSTPCLVRASWHYRHDARGHVGEGVTKPPTKKLENKGLRLYGRGPSFLFAAELAPSGLTFPEDFQNLALS